MATQEYLLALGENRWAFADADYALVFLLMTIDRNFQAQVDFPKTSGEVVTPGRLAELFAVRVAKLSLSADLRDKANRLIADWAELAESRNNLAHAWGYVDASAVGQLGGYSHKFPRGDAAIHKRMIWPLDQVQRMTAECRKISARITDWRLHYEQSLNQVEKPFGA